MTTTAPALAWLAPRRGEMEALLETLVNIDSFSADKAGNDRVLEALAAFLAGDGVNLERIPVARFGDALRVTVGGGGNAHALMMGHRDTVFPTGTVAARPYRTAGDRAYGPGVADMKGGLVLIAFVLKAFAETGSAPYPLVALFTGDEEIGSDTGRPIIEATAAGARAVLNMEPGRASGNVVSARKGGFWMKIEVSGKAAHAGVNHQAGCSAIEALARKIPRLHALTDYAAGITTNVGVIAGGIGHNTVASWASAELDVRIVAEAQRAPVAAAIAAILAAEEVPGTVATGTTMSHRVPMAAETSADLLAQYRAAAAELGFAVEGEFTGGCADSGFTAAMGVPTLCGLGPVGEKAHTDEEVCHLDTLVPRAQAVAATLLSLA
ncbi:Peptidase M20:peptidase M20 [uncultured Alphaproteobacteria bacterium]|uniref:Peptidase M20:peptidase M20 n=1 Tax=uncultured Alphaproteobacteria bacterium TaxID=91750 RepID=A0A212K3U8_9PROT|nr:Peptidase M20:peptidase M20 [uncultured Alphaproteobacteria bacterium]